MEKLTTEKKGVKTPLNGTSKKEPKEIALPKVAEAIKKIDAILVPNAKGKIKKLETANVLAKRFEAVSSKYDDLTHYMAGKDDNNCTMKFNSESGYSFTLKNPAITNKLLEIVEAQFSDIVEKAENDLLNFSI